MARLNNVELYGYVTNRIVKKDVESGELTSGSLYLGTFRLPYASASPERYDEFIYDKPCVYTKDPAIIKIINEINPGDVVSVRGSLSTQDVPRRHICKRCGHIQFAEKGTIIYIDPIGIKITERGMSETNPNGIDASQGYNLIRKNVFMSNIIFIVGTICREVLPGDYYADPDGDRKKDSFQFQIASKRARRIEEDGADKRADFPWVKVRGEKSEEYFKALHLNSSVLIQGCIQTRSVKRFVPCENCGEQIESQSIATEISPYFIEYLDNCEKPFVPIAEDGEILEYEKDW